LIVLDASVAVDWLLQTSAGMRAHDRIASSRQSLHAPEILDLEVAQVLRRLVREGVISASRAEGAIEDLLDLPVTRYPHAILLSRIWELRNNLTAYDAAYLVLAEKLGATLLTRDKALLSAAGLSAHVELI
jgi:predicted nucleic acid-binding protein